MIQVGSRVRYSAAGLRPLYESMVEYLSGPIRAKREREYKARQAERGTVTEITVSPFGNPSGVRLIWDDGHPGAVSMAWIELAE